ncbi:hypothetical protein P8452_58024 [Trifolium repens]|nr:hypothetical protein P8452_58024 [Trifolium repens]
MNFLAITSKSRLCFSIVFIIQPNFLFYKLCQYKEKRFYNDERRTILHGIRRRVGGSNWMSFLIALLSNLLLRHILSNSN